MATYDHEECEATFDGDASSLTGNALYEVFTDIEDGSEVVTRSELMHVQLDGLRLDRDQMVMMMGEGVIGRCEDLAAEEIQIQIDAGDLREAA